MNSAVVVYAQGSRTIRRVIVSDEDATVKAALVPGEALLVVPFTTYTQSNAADLRDFVAQQIGPPTHNCRCVEVDRTGTVVAVYHADPAIDSPIALGNTMELHDTAAVGDVKQLGAFPLPPVGVLAAAGIVHQLKVLGEQ